MKRKLKRRLAVNEVQSTQPKGDNDYRGALFFFSVQVHKFYDMLLFWVDMLSFYQIEQIILL